jgi:hypothetical protein
MAVDVVVPVSVAPLPPVIATLTTLVLPGTVFPYASWIVTIDWVARVKAPPLYVRACVEPATFIESYMVLMQPIFVRQLWILKPFCAKIGGSRSNSQDVI